MTRQSLSSITVIHWVTGGIWGNVGIRRCPRSPDVPLLIRLPGAQSAPVLRAMCLYTDLTRLVLDAM